MKRFEIIVEVISDEEDLKVQKSFNPATQQFTYTPIIQREELDTKGEDSISLNFSVADISDISTKSSDFSKTITLPATDRNRRVFSLCAELGVDNGFNSKRFTRCYVLVETLIVFEGYLQLQNYNVTAGKNGEFEVNIRSSAVNFFNSLGDAKLQDLDWRSLQTKWTYANIQNTWSFDTASELYYPLMDPGMNIASFDYPKGNLTDYSRPQGIPRLSNVPKLMPGSTFVENFYPGVYLKSFLDRMFAYTGYRYTSSFLNSDLFAKMFVPYCGPKAMLMNDVNTAGTASLSYDRVFKIGRTNNKQLSTNVVDTVAYPNAEEYSVSFNNITAPYSDPSNSFGSGLYYQNLSTEVTKMRFTVGCEFYADNGLFDKDGTSAQAADFNQLQKIEILLYREMPYDWQPLGLDRNWNAGRGYAIKTWTLFDANSSGDAEITEPTWTTQVGGTTKCGFYVSLTSDWLDNPSWAYALGKGTTTQGFGKQVDNALSASIFKTRAAIQPNEKVRVCIRVTHTLPGTLFFQSKNSYLYNSVATETVNGGRIDVDRIVPQGVKCQDFMKSLINMFNLHIEPSKDDEKMLIIEPREQFFSLGKAVDWSNKIDLSKPIKLEILANTQSRRNKFTLKTDKDWSNTNYNTSYSEPYGTRNYDTGSQYNTSTTTIESLFAAAPLIKYNDNVYWVNNTEKITDGPAYDLWPENTFAATIPRVLFANKNKISTTNTPCIKFMFDQISYAVAGTTYYFYPYAGPLDDIHSPTFDLNYAQPRAMYYGLSNGLNVTQNNFFNNYWKTQMDELSDKDSRLVSLYVMLDANDLASLTFSNEVYLQFSHPTLGTSSGSYFRINSIEDYNPSVQQSTLVKLLKTNKT